MSKLVDKVLFVLLACCLVVLGLLIYTDSDAGQIEFSRSEGIWYLEGCISKDGEPEQCQVALPDQTTPIVFPDLPAGNYCYWFSSACDGECHPSDPTTPVCVEIYPDE